MKLLKTKASSPFTIILLAVCIVCILQPFVLYTAKDKTAQEYEAFLYAQQQSGDPSFAENNNEALTSLSQHWILSTYFKYLQANTEQDMYDVLIADPSSVTSTDKTRLLDQFRSELYYIGPEYEQVQYYVVDQNQKTLVTNNDNLKEYINDEELPSQYRAWYLKVSYDDQGKALVNNTTNNTTIDFETILNAIAPQQVNGEFMQINKIKNLTFFFMVDSDSSIPNIKASSKANFDSASTITGYTTQNYQLVILSLTTLVIIASCFLQHTEEEKKTLFFYVACLPLEIMILLTVVAFYDILHIDYQNFIPDSFAITAVLDTLVYVCLSIVYFTAIYLCAYTIKTAIRTGIKQSFQQLSLFKQGKNKAKLAIKEYHKQLLEAQTRQKKFNYLAGMLGVLLLILALICFTSLYYICIYILLLLLLAWVNISVVKEDYDHLLSIQNNIMKGNYDQSMSDLGMYEQSKQSLIGIQDSIKDTVAKELSAQRMKIELITNVSHDLKTPLTSMISYIDLLQNDKLDKATQQQYLDIINNSSQRLKHLIEDLFELSKANSGTLPLHLANVDLIALIQQVELESTQALAEKGLILKHTFSDQKLILLLDPEKTYRIFENLYSNIAKYALENTRVFIDVTYYESRVDITFKNISKLELTVPPDELVERFTRGDTSRSTEGSGLGLSIAKSFTELMNGSMHLTSDGDVFKVTLSFYKKDV